MSETRNKQTSSTSQHPFCTNTKKIKKYSEGFTIFSNNDHSLQGNVLKVLNFHRSKQYLSKYDRRYTVNEASKELGIDRTTFMAANKQLEVMGRLNVKRSWADYCRRTINKYQVVENPVSAKHYQSRNFRLLCKRTKTEKNIITKITSTAIVYNDPIVSDQKIDKKDVVKKISFQYKPRIETPIEVNLNNLIPMCDDPKSKAVYEAAGNVVTLLNEASDRKGIGDNRKACRLINKLIKRFTAEKVSNAVLNLVDTAKDRLYRDRDTRRIISLIETTIKIGKDYKWRDVKD
jgi:hypothetical protein